MIRRQLARTFSSSSAPATRLKTFDNQQKLPRLPIPSLESTAQKYLRSLRALVVQSGKESADNSSQLNNSLLTESEYKKSEESVHSFLSGIGQTLQQRLLDYDKTQKNSWLEDIWYKKAYLEWREPIMINVNWWLQFRDVPASSIWLKQPPAKGEFTTVQISRAAGIINNLLNYKNALDSGNVPPDTISKRHIPLCMNQLRMQFGVTRIPTKSCDVIRQEFPSRATHIIVMMDDQIYKVDVMGKNGERVSLSALKQQLRSAVELHGKLSSDRQAAVSLLTSEHRDTWTEARESLLKISEKNKDSLEAIETALFAVCLDSFSTSDDLDLSHRMIFHGNNGHNRWFDKSLSFVFMNNGRGGCNGEHSPSDAVVPGQIIQEVLENEPAKDPVNVENAALVTPKRLDWVVDEKITASIEKAEKRAIEDIADVDSVLLHYAGYGSEKIKTAAQVSPDAFVQMALQLAYYRTYHAQCATYESASTRQFLHGRTETIRSCSTDSVHFASKFDDESVKKVEKIEALKRAIGTHVLYAVDASNGRGVDRHLLGLRCMLQPGEKAEIFEDPSYLKSMNFKLSTSNVSPGDYYYGGFGPVVPDGYGINYAIGRKMLKFSISSRRQSKETCSRSFRKVLEGSLNDLMSLLEERHS